MKSQRTLAASSDNLQALVAKLSQANVLVIGDLMLDEFIWGKVSRISPEAPVPVVWVERESTMPGGAANVANNICTLGGKVSVLGVVGKDRYAETLLRDLKARRVDVSGVIAVDRPTTVKTRVIAHHQQVVRVDREQPAALPARAVAELIEAVSQRLSQVDAIVLEDYGKGVIGRQLLEAVVPMARLKRKIITVDPKEEHFDLYKGVTCLTPNRKEAGEAVGRELQTEADVRRAAQEILRRLSCEALLVTLGEDGMCLFEKSGRRVQIPTVAQEVFDVAGAGDTVIATFTLALAAGAGFEAAARLANFAAGIVVGKVGVAVVTPQELGNKLAQNNGLRSRGTQGPIGRRR